MDFIIEKDYDGATVKEYIQKAVRLSRTQTTALKKLERGIMLGGERVTVRALLHAGDILSLEIEEKENSSILPCGSIPPILFEDEYIIVVDKPSFMPTHPSHGHYTDSLANAVCAYFKDRNFVFRSINRLDNETDGPVLIAKDARSAAILYRDMQSGRIEKSYLALLDGVPTKQSGSVDKNIARDGESIITRHVSDTEGRRAITVYEVIEKCGEYCMARCLPKTGRTHQIRVHMRSIGCPLIGDRLYNDKNTFCFSRTALHAERIAFTHPISGEKIEIRSEMKDDMKDAWRRIKEKTE